MAPFPTLTLTKGGALRRIASLLDLYFRFIAVWSPLAQWILAVFDPNFTTGPLGCVYWWDRRTFRLCRFLFLIFIGYLGNAQFWYKHKHQTQIFEVNALNITHVKRAHISSTCWYRRPLHLIYQYHIKEKIIYKKRNGQKQLENIYKCIMANTSVIWQQAAYTSYHRLVAQQEPYKQKKA